MKKLLLLSLLSPLLAISQDSTTVPCKLIRETDPFTKEVRLSTGFIFLDGGSVTVDADAKEIDVLFSIEGAEKCYDNNSTAWIFFEGVKSKLTTRNGGTMNCEGLFHFIFKNSKTSTPSILQKLMTQKINHVTFIGNNGKESVINLTPSDQQKLSAMATCLVTEAKLLVK